MDLGFMKKMADPMIALLKFQQILNVGPSVDPSDLDGCYLTMYDEPNGGKRFSFVKIVDDEAQVLAIFGIEDPINGVECWSIGYAVSEKHRRRGLAIEAVNKGIDVLKNKFIRSKVKSFYISAVIDVKNIPSVRLAEKLFSKQGVPAIENYSGTPSLYFKKLIVI